MSAYKNTQPDVHQSQTKRGKTRPSSTASSKSGSRYAPEEDDPENQRRWNNERRPPAIARTPSTESQHSVYDEIPHDQVTSNNPPKHRSINNNRGSVVSDPAVPVTRRPPGTNSAISMKPDGAGQHSARHSNISAAAPDMVDLNMSSLSQGSNVSVVTLGGVEYPVGSRIGKTGMFVIGDPTTFSQPEITSCHSSMPSVISSSAPFYQSKGIAYGFESWNWSAIRFVIFIIICLIMLALLAAVIALAIGQQDTCVAHFEWWKGSTFYSLSVPYFSDSDNSKIGDLLGVEKKVSYFELMAFGAVVMKNFFPSKLNQWESVMSFTDVDPRLGTLSDFQVLVNTLHERNIKLMIQMCPWYTSTDHIWYRESRESSVVSSNKYRDFYIWSTEPDPRRHGQWAYDEVRSQYYLHYGDKSRPVLDWTNKKVRNAFNGVLELWLQRHVDGFVLCDLNKFHTEDFDFLEQFRSTLARYSKNDEDQRVLAVDSDFITETARLNYQLFEDYIGLREPGSRIADMILTPFYMEERNTTGGLVSRIQTALQWQSGEDAPWILWNLVRLSEINVRYVTALHLMELMLPGTPQYTAGEEIGVYYQDNSTKYQAPMMWLPDSSVPANPGSQLGSDHVWALRNISTTRRNVFSLRFDRAFGEKGSSVNLEIVALDEEQNFILFSRYYPLDKTYYFAGNFGNKRITKDLQQIITPWATVLADSNNKYFGRLELRDVALDPGQAVIFYPTK